MFESRAHRLGGPYTREGPVHPVVSARAEAERSRGSGEFRRPGRVAWSGTATGGVMAFGARSHWIELAEVGLRGDAGIPMSEMVGMGEMVDRHEPWIRRVDYRLTASPARS